MRVKKLKFSPTYKKENGIFVINIDKVGSLPFEAREKSLVNIPPKELGGNHKHPRWEAFVALNSELELIWQDKNGSSEKEIMRKGSKLFLYIIPPNTPHAVVNKSVKNPGILFEIASESQHDVELVDLEVQ